MPPEISTTVMWIRAAAKRVCFLLLLAEKYVPSVRPDLLPPNPIQKLRAVSGEQPDTVPCFSL